MNGNIAGLDRKRMLLEDAALILAEAAACLADGSEHVLALKANMLAAIVQALHDEILNSGMYPLTERT